MGLFSHVAITGWEQSARISLFCQMFAAGLLWFPLVSARMTAPHSHHGGLSPVRQANQGQVSTLHESSVFVQACVPSRRVQTVGTGAVWEFSVLQICRF